MKVIILVALACVVAASARPGSTYDEKWDNINVDEILESERLRNSFVECLLDKARCPPEGKALKEVLPEALNNECSKCTNKQKEGAEKVITYFVNKQPDQWKELAVVYDPDNVYQVKYKDRIDAVKSKA